MSTTTDVLSLFKYDPVADADSTFNITQALNNNWDKLDAAILLAIAAAGAYNPEESYAVGDYCTYKGKLHKCGTEIPDGEAWTAEHWTETTVAAELADIRASLSNKAERFGSTESLDDLIFLPSGFYQISVPATGMPYADYWYCILWSDNNTQSSSYYSKTVFAINGNNDELWYLRITNSVKGKWTKVSNATPPQEVPLPLASGVTELNVATAEKTQEGIVLVNAWVGFDSPVIANTETQVAIMPENMRPKKTVGVSAIVNSGDDENLGFARISIDSGGVVRILSDVTFSFAVFSIAFPVGG